MIVYDPFLNYFIFMELCCYYRFKYYNGKKLTSQIILGQIFHNPCITYIMKKKMEKSSEIMAILFSLTQFIYSYKQVDVECSCCILRETLAYFTSSIFLLFPVRSALLFFFFLLPKEWIIKV